LKSGAESGHDWKVIAYTWPYAVDMASGTARGDE